MKLFTREFGQEVNAKETTNTILTAADLMQIRGGDGNLGGIVKK